MSSSRRPPTAIRTSSRRAGSTSRSSTRAGPRSTASTRRPRTARSSTGWPGRSSTTRRWPWASCRGMSRPRRCDPCREPTARTCPCRCGPSAMSGRSRSTSPPGRWPAPCSWGRTRTTTSATAARTWCSSARRTAPGGRRLADGSWQRFRDDQDFDTRFLWEDRLFSRSLVTLEWTVPAGAAGTCRFVYQGDRRTGLRRILPITATNRAFTVR